MSITVISPELQERYFKQESYIYHSIDLEEEIVSIRALPIHNFKDYDVICSLPARTIVAGGYVLGLLRDRSNQIGDIDLYSENESKFLELTEFLEKNGYKNREDNPKFKFADTFQKPGRFNIQLIRTLWFNSPSHVIDTFDFTVCQFAIQDGFLIFNPMGMLDGTRKELIINRLNFPHTMLKRIDKYKDKGYTMPDIMRKKLNDALAKTESEPGIESQLFPNGSAY